MLTRLFSKAAPAWRPALALMAVAGVVAVAGCGGSGAKSSNASHSNAASATPANSGGSSTSISMEVLNGERATKLGHLGPDGKGHDMFLPSNLNVKVGDTVTVTVANYDEGPHTFTSPDLGVNATIAPATNADKGVPSKTTFKFTVKKAGKFRWYCMVPCDGKQKGWAMTPGSAGPDQDKYMAGYVVAS